MISLNVRAPEFFPRATDVIPEIVTAVNELLQAGVAYEAAGNVYYAIKDWPAFGRLSGLPYVEMLPIANERGNHPDDPNKRDPLDFVLWQAQAMPNEPAWESPWGLGRPGWHIECSTMATRYLGETIDIHSGGADLLFPHHECEIAQVEALPDRDTFTRYWMHAAMVYHEGEKMSKSLGNLVMIRDLLEDWSPDALRYYLASHNYRESWSFDPARLAEMAMRADALCQAMNVEGVFGSPIDVTPIIDRFAAAMDDDLDTPGALAALDELGAHILQAAEAGKEVAPAQESLRLMAQVFGLTLEREGPEPRVRANWEKHLAGFQSE
jgi:L-cysteine:1D-myo-inositol 2-amino-2-deoxy-alpha-D-glucopyranoside ligase